MCSLITMNIQVNLLSPSSSSPTDVDQHCYSVRCQLSLPLTIIHFQLHLQFHHCILSAHCLLVYSFHSISRSTLTHNKIFVSTFRDFRITLERFLLFVRTGGCPSLPWIPLMILMLRSHLNFLYRNNLPQNSPTRYYPRYYTIFHQPLSCSPIKQP